MLKHYAIKIVFLIFPLVCITHFSYSQVRIVCMGNSITQGKIDAAKDSITELSYRFWLWEKLDSAGIKVDMVGYHNRFFLEDSTHKAQTPQSRYSNNIFDRNNDAYYGITSSHFLKGTSSTGWTGKALPPLKDRLNDKQLGYTPDIALIHIGSNDSDSIVAITTANIEAMIDILRAKNKHVVIFLAKLITGWKAINKNIETIAAKKSTPRSPVIVVDMASGFINDPKAAGTHTFDWVHPNPRGQQFMAERWFNAISVYRQKGKFK